MRDSDEYEVGEGHQWPLKRSGQKCSFDVLVDGIGWFCGSEVWMISSAMVDFVDVKIIVLI